MCGASGLIQAQDKSAPTGVSKIVECIKVGDVACVTEFLSNGGNAKAVDEKGVPLLTIAAEKKSGTVVRLLLNAGAAVNDGGSGDGTPLCRAALYGRKEIAQTLLEAGATANVICGSDHGDSALMEAIRGAMFSQEPYAIMLQAEEFSERDSPAEDYIEIARMLLTRGVDVNVVAKCDVGESALMYAAMAADVEMVKALFAHGAVIKQESPILDVLREVELEYRRAKSTPVPALSRQQTVLVDWIEKTRSRRDDIARLLKAAGDNEDDRDQEAIDYKQNAVEYAQEAFDDVIERNDTKDFERLVAAYVNHSLGRTVLANALRSAVINSRIEMVKLLLERGVSPNPVSSAPTYTTLMQAAGSANLELVKLLLDAGAEINAQDETGKTALDEAQVYAHSSEQRRAVAAFLLARGARSGKEKR
jgi:hypothetical protein